MPSHIKDLDSIEPATALDLYLDHRESEVTETTHRAHRYRLQHFVRWAEGEDVDEPRLTDMNELTGRDLHEYRVWRRREGDLNVVSVRTQMSTVRRFLKFCETIDAVPLNTHEKVVIPTLGREEGHRERMLEAEKAEQLIDYLSTYHYASFDHVLMKIFWHTGMRIGGVHSLDVDDFDRDKRRLFVEHRPEQGTTLKNGRGGQRVVALSGSATHAIYDYIQTNRETVTDDHGREPLLATRWGRPNKTTLRETVYKLTQPCYYTGECPSDRDIPGCEYRHGDTKAQCPWNVSPHDIRRGSITYYLSSDAPKEAVSDRMNVKTDTLDKHYDKRTEEGKAEQRRQFFDAE